MAIDSSNKLVTLENLKRFKNNLDTYIAGDNITFTPDVLDTHKITISSSGNSGANYTFEVGSDGNLYIVYPDGEAAPVGYSIDSNGYLIYNDGK